MLLRRRTEMPILTRYQAEQRTESGLLTCRFITAHNMLATTMRQYVVTDGGYSNSIVIPRHSSEKRKYVPLIYCKERVMVNDSVYIIPNTDLFVFGLLSSSMHNAWVRMFCGRLDMRIRYSNILCYKNFPFPEDITTEQKENIARLAARILELRMNYKDSHSAMSIMTYRLSCCLPISIWTKQLKDFMANSFSIMTTDGSKF